MASEAPASPYVRGFAVVDFDVDVGQTTRLVHPRVCVSEEESRKLAYLSLPDSNTSLLRDVVYTFRLRSDIIPLFASNALDHSYSFGCAYFRQRRDASQRRGFVQQSVVVVSHTPYVGLLKQVARVVGHHYLEADEYLRRTRQHMASALAVDAPEAPEDAPAADLPELVLHAAMEEICRWPPPVPGTQLELPLLGSLLTFRVPWTGLHAHRTLLQRDVPTRRHASAFALPLEVVGVDDGAGSPSGTPAGTAPQEDGVGVVSLRPGATSSTVSLRRFSNASDAHAEDDTPRGADEPPGAASVRADAQVATGVALPPRTLTLGDVFATKNQELPGMFQEIGLFSVFRSMVPCLWHLWELAITGQPILVMGPSPELCGDAVLGIVSLISPLDYCADFRPYFTLYDPDFAQIARLADTLWGTHTRSPSLMPISVLAGSAARRGGIISSPPRPHRSSVSSAVVASPELSAGVGGDTPATVSPALGGRSALPPPMMTAMAGANFDGRALTAQASPPLLIGTTNPFFTKALERWPNALWMGNSGGASPGAVSGIRAPSLRPSGTSTPRSSSAPRGSSSAEADAEPVSLRTSPRPTPRSSIMSFAAATRGYTVSDARIRIVNPTTSLANVLPAPGQETVTEAIFVVRQAAHVVADAGVLTSLLRVRPEDEAGVQLRLGGVTPSKASRATPVASLSPRGFGTGITFQGPDATDGGHIPAVVINNAILRQHFRQLTSAFLRPFERFFHSDPTAVAATNAVNRPPSAVLGPFGAGQPIPDEHAAASPQPAMSGGAVPTDGPASQPAPTARVPSGRFMRAAAPARVVPANDAPANTEPVAAARGSFAAPSGAPAQFGPYDDLPALCLPRFEESAFLRTLEAAGGPKHRLLRQSNWRALYAAFLRSPHFYPWFHARRREASRALFDVARKLRMNLSREDLVAGLGLAQGVYASMAWVPAPPALAHDTTGMDARGAQAAAVPPAPGSMPGSRSPTASVTLSGRGAALPGPLPRVVGRGSPHALAIAAGHARGLAGTSPPPPSVQIVGSPPSTAPTASPSASAATEVGAALADPQVIVGAAPLRRITSSQLQQHEAAALELHRKIVACFVRESAFLDTDDVLADLMRDHLRAVEAVMPPRMLASLSHARSIRGVLGGVL